MAGYVLIEKTFIVIKLLPSRSTPLLSYRMHGSDATMTCDMPLPNLHIHTYDLNFLSNFPTSSYATQQHTRTNHHLTNHYYVSLPPNKLIWQFFPSAVHF